MNKIVVVNNVLEKQHLPKSIVLEWKEEYIPKLKIKICKSTSLMLDIISREESKIDIQIELSPQVKCQLIIKNIGHKSKILTKYLLSENSYLNLVKLADIDVANSREIVELNESNAKIDYVLKTVCKDNEKYDLIINHNQKKTISNITNHGLNIEKGNLVFNVSTYIPSGMKECIANQNNRIINLTDRECTIRPNLLIDEYDVVANHAAHIGSFTQNDVFYLERVGIPYQEATKLLMQGFMKSLVDENIITKIFAKYWR